MKANSLVRISSRRSRPALSSGAWRGGAGVILEALTQQPSASGYFLGTAALLEAAAHGCLGDFRIGKEGHGREGPGFAGRPTRHSAQGPALVEIGLIPAQVELIQGVHNFSP